MPNPTPVTLQTTLPVFAGEVGRRRLLVGVVFALIALAALGVGLLWPKTYQASTTILVQQNRIIAPLMEGAATPTASASRAEIARAIILSHDSIEEVITKGGWLTGDPDPEQVAKIIRDVKGRTQVRFSRDNLLTISYTDSDPERTYEVTNLFKDIFIRKSLASKQEESREAYEFIASQVDAYQKKLATVEESLKTYYENNPDARAGNEQTVSGRIAQLRTQVQQTRIELAEKQSRAASLQKQLSGQTEISVVQTAAGIYRSQLAQLQTKLDQLLLNYTDEYPDVVRTRHQMQDLRQQLASAEQKAAQPSQSTDDDATALDSNVRYNPLYNQLNGDLASVRSDIAALSSRLDVGEKLLSQALGHSRDIASSEKVTAELTRDYAVNKQVYEDLLQRREKARVSMQLDATHQGLSFQIQDPPVMPVTPTGLRLMHFAMLGLMLGVAVPVGLLFGVVRFDPRVRSAEQIERQVGLPVLAVVPVDKSPRDRRVQALKTILMVLLVCAVLAIYAGVYLAKLMGVL